MAEKKPEMVQVRLGGDPYNSDLFCPYCGEQILEAGSDGVSQCPHLILADIEMDVEQEFFSNDLCFVLFEPAPACREHYFVFREGDGFQEEDGLKA